jgi:two-component system nitrate/nitrite response regulator NarL
LLSFEDVLDRLHAAAKGRLVVSDYVVEIIARALRDEDRPKDAEDAGLTEREQEILALIASGLSNKSIVQMRPLNQTRP